ncbi:hypothetical protein OH77DRAFT_1584524 [Trametes cingulata]|nr:hypothetical protein OH77DRAFT_1584524 [Trametes cingulata]
MAAEEHLESSATIERGRSTLVFPLEIWTLILNRIRYPSDVATMARVCRAMRFEAEAVLYHHVTIGPDAERLLCFSRTLSGCPRRASSVRELHIEAVGANEASEAPLTEAIATILRMVEHLQGLEINVVADDFMRRCLNADVLNVQLPALRRFYTNFPAHDALLRFLRRNAHIQELKHDTIFPHLEWNTPDAFPHLELLSLRKLTCRSRLLSHLATLPQLTHLYMPSYLLHDLPNVARLFGEGLVSLRLGLPKMMLGRPGPRWTFDDIHANFPRLLYLRMDEYQSTAKLAGRGFDFDAAPHPRVANAPAKLTFAWVAMWTPDRESTALAFVQTTVTPKAEDLLKRWSPYLNRIVFWVDGLYEQTFVSFALGPGGEVTVVREADLKEEYLQA